MSLILSFLGLISTFIYRRLFINQISKYFLDLKIKRQVYSKPVDFRGADDFKKMSKTLIRMFSFERYVDINNAVDDLVL